MSIEPYQDLCGGFSHCCHLGTQVGGLIFVVCSRKLRALSQSLCQLFVTFIVFYC